MGARVYYVNEARTNSEWGGSTHGRPLTTADYDRGDKFNLLYKRMETLREYVLVNARAIAVEVRRRAEDGRWEQRSYGPNATIPLESLAAALPIAALYARVSLA